MNLLGKNSPIFAESNKNGNKNKKETKKPRSPFGGEEPPKGRFNLKSLLMLLFVLTVIMTVSNSFTKEKNPPVAVSYTEFVQKIKENQISHIEEKEGNIVGVSASDINKRFTTRMITNRLGDDQVLVGLINMSKAELKSVPPAETPFLASLLISWFPMLLLIGVWIFMLSKMGKGGSGGPQIFNVGKSKVKENGEGISQVTFDDVAGIDEAKVELQEIVEFLKHPNKYKKIGAKIPKGVLLLGSPGTGKTLLAKAIAGEAGVPFLSMSGSEFVEMFVGVGASRVRDLFAKARKASPCIVFIDEIDAVGRKRGSGQGGGNDEREQTLNQLLVEMDGFGNEETVIIIAATNRPEVLDTALMRPGRFDRQVVVDPPNIKGREEILKVHAKNKKFGKDVDLGILARKTPGFVGADLANLLNEAAILAARENRDFISMSDLEEASEKVAIGPERKSKVTVEKERHIIAYHEIGHALVQTLLPYTEPVHKVTIIPRGSAALGYTMSLPTEDKYLKSKKEYLSEIRVLLGGRGAEQVIFDDITTGASNDIERATAIAHAMVTRFGMTDKFGPILLDSTSEGDMFAQKHYSDVTGKDVDDEIRGIVTTAYNDVLNLLRENYTMLDNLSKTLLERETITGEEVKLILAGEILPPLVAKEKKISENESEERVEEELEKAPDKVFYDGVNSEEISEIKTHDKREEDNEIEANENQVEEDPILKKLKEIEEQIELEATDEIFLNESEELLKDIEIEEKTKEDSNK